MAMQDTGDAGLTALFNTYYTKRALERLVPKLAFYEVAEKRPMPQGAGKTIDFFRWKNLSAIRTNMSELTVPTQVGMSSVRLTATVVQRGAYNYIDELVDLTARSPMIEAQADLFGEQGAKTIDTYIQDVIGAVVADVALRSSLRVNGRGTLNSSGIGVRIYSGSDDGESFPLLINKARLATSSTVVGRTKSGLSVKAIQHGVSFLQSRNASTFDDGLYRGFMNPYVAYQLQSTLKGWTQYTDPLIAKPNQPGMGGVIAGVRFTVSSNVTSFPLSGDNLGEASGSIYQTIIVGKQAYGVTEISSSGQSRGFKMYIKQSGDQTTSDPVSQKISVGWKTTIAAKVLNKSAGVIILSTIS